MAKLLVIGASRGIELETVKAALLAGHSVRALARSAASIPIQNTKLDKVSGDALDADTIRNALKDVEAVIQTLGLDISPLPSSIPRHCSRNQHASCRRHEGCRREAAHRGDGSRRR